MQKSLLGTACILFTGFSLIAQPAMMYAPVEKTDTTVRYVDGSGRQQDALYATHIQKTWRENGKYLLHLYTNDADKKLVRKTTYADSALQVLDGPFENYYPNGLPKDSGSYANKKRDGTFKSWYEEGVLLSVFHYANGIKIDTGKTFSKEGRLQSLSILDKAGNGIQTEYYPDGSIRLTGPITAGNKNGTWTLNRENGTKQMQVEFIRDSVGQTTCFAEDGSSISDGPCVYEKFARFPGGTEGWRNYLMKNLQYPKAAIDREIQGTVILEFMVDTDGTLGDIKVVSSPHELLTNEALRLMKVSPKWEPAIQYNKTVKGRLRQPFYFRLQ